MYEILCVVGWEVFHSELTKCKIRTQGDVLGKFIFISQPLSDNAVTFWALMSQTQVFYPAEVFEFHCVKLYVNVQILLSHPATLHRAHRPLEPVTLAVHSGNSLGEAPLQESSCPKDASVQP